MKSQCARKILHMCGAQISEILAINCNIVKAAAGKFNT